MNEVRAVIPYGTLVGTADGRGNAFLGVRYAEAPVGSLRFLPPVPVRRQREEVDARSPGASPWQLIRPEPDWSGQVPPSLMSEDCLNLNVFTPAVDDARRPVLVHLFGGGFQNGSANSPLQDGMSLASAGDVVVVRVSFRVGALGFLHLGEAFGPPFNAGNVALLDVCAALAWVRDNIAGLGGDPDCVTLFGLSSGAFMAAAMFGVPASAGLYHRAWMQSGSTSRIIDPDVATMQAREFLAAVDVAPGDADALRRVPVERVLDAQMRIVSTDLGERNAPGGRTLGVVLDGTTVTAHPLDALRSGERRSVQIVAGATHDEARLWFARGLLKPATSDAMLLDELARFAGGIDASRLLLTYCAAYPDASHGFLRERILTDVIYRLPALRMARAQAGAGGSAYAYRFDWISPIMDGSLGASHGFDEAFVWNNLRLAPFTGDGETAAPVAAALSAALLAFARTGSPGWPAFAPPYHVQLFGSSSERATVSDNDWLLSTWDGVERA